MDQQDLSLYHDDMPGGSERKPEKTQQTPQTEDKKAEMDAKTKAIVQQLVEFDKFDLIHKIYFLMLSRDTLTKESEPLTEDKSQFKSFIENYSKATYLIIRNYLQKKNTATLNEEINKLAKTFIASGHAASELYAKDALFSLRGFEMLKLFLSSTFVIPLIKKADSKLLYNDIKTIRNSSREREITTDYTEKLGAAIANLTNSTLDLTYSSYALKRSLGLFTTLYKRDLEKNYELHESEYIITVPFPAEYEGDKDPDYANKVYIKIDKEYKDYYNEKLQAIVEKFLDGDITKSKAVYFFSTVEMYLALATHLIRHKNPEIGIHIVLSLADVCSKGFAKNLKEEDYQKVELLKEVCSTTINHALTILYASANFIDEHEVKALYQQVKEMFSEPKDHFMGTTSLDVYLNCWATLTKYGKDGLDSFMNRSSKKNDYKSY